MSGKLKENHNKPIEERFVLERLLMRIDKETFLKELVECPISSGNVLSFPLSPVFSLTYPSVLIVYLLSTRSQSIERLTPKASIHEGFQKR